METQPTLADTCAGGVDLDSITLDLCRRHVDEMVLLTEAEIEVSLFLDPDPAQIDVAADLGVTAVELHTGNFALAANKHERDAELMKLATAARQLQQADLTVNAGHGLTYRNVKPVAQLESMHELNIGHSIISRSVFVGLIEATRLMKQLID